MKALFLLSMVSLCSHCIGQTSKFLGKHYGQHENWEYFNSLSTSRSGDTLTYLEIRNNRNELLPAMPQHRHAIKLLLTKEGHSLIYDSAFYFGNLLFVARGQGDSIVVNDLAIKKRANLFSSLESFQLFLKFTDINKSFNRDIYFLDIPSPRLFSAKVVDEVTLSPPHSTSKKTYELAIFSLDSSNVGDAKLFISKDGHDVLRKEYVVNEKSRDGNFKSIASEMFVSNDYEIDLTSIDSPTEGDYLEQAFTILNKKGDYKKAMQYIETALAQNVSSNSLQAYLTVLENFEPKTDPLKIIKRFWNSPNLSAYDIHLLARDYLRKNKLSTAKELFEFNHSKHPDNYITYVGMARVYNEVGEIRKAKSFLENALKLEIDKPNRDNIEKNIERLNSGQKMSG